MQSEQEGFMKYSNNYSLIILYETLSHLGLNVWFIKSSFFIINLQIFLFIVIYSTIDNEKYIEMLEIHFSVIMTKVKQHYYTISASKRKLSKKYIIAIKKLVTV